MDPKVVAAQAAAAVAAKAAAAWSVANPQRVQVA